jgi:tRNA1Val (adenine37-N6)-methyltransferase
MEPLTRDPFLEGRIFLSQPKHGYRFSIDAVIIAHLCCPAPGDIVLDLGTGCGVIPIMLAYRHPDIRIVGVEVQSGLSRLARQNAVDNHMGDRIRIVEKDMGQLVLTDVGGAVDLVVSNPPYRQIHSGRLNTDSQKAVARHELKVDLKTLLATVRRMLNKSGRFCVIYPSVRTVDLLTAMRVADLEPKTLTMIHSKPSEPARLVAIEGIRGGRPGLSVEAPLYVYNTDDSYSHKIAAMLAG